VSLEEITAKWGQANTSSLARDDNFEFHLKELSRLGEHITSYTTDD